MGTALPVHRIETRREANSKPVEVAVEGVEGIKAGEIGKALDPNPMTGVGVIKTRAIWAEESTSMFTSSPLDLPD